MFLENNEFSALEVWVKMIENIKKISYFVDFIQNFPIFRCLFGANSGSHRKPILHFSDFRVPGHRGWAPLPGTRRRFKLWGAIFWNSIVMLEQMFPNKWNRFIVFLTMRTVIHTHPHNTSIFIEIHPPTCPCLGGKYWQRQGDKNHNPFRFGRGNRTICQQNAISGFSPCTRHQEKHGPC